jgi:hypothetical protein
LGYLRYTKLKEEFEASGGYATLPIYPEVQEELYNMYQHGIVLLVYTARPNQTHSRIWNDTWQWLEQNNLAEMIWELRIGKEQRIERACKLKAQGHKVIMLEDEPDTVLRASSAGIKVLMRKQPYNMGIAPNPNISLFTTLDCHKVRIHLEDLQ